MMIKKGTIMKKYIIPVLSIAVCLYSAGCRILLSAAEGDRGSAAVPVFSPAPALIDTPTPVSITCATPGSTIFYTTDNSLPERDSGTTAEYASPVTVAPGTLLRAYSAADGMDDSEVVTGYFSSSSTEVQLGINVSWFNTWNESQPLANAASASRNASAIEDPLPVDTEGQPNVDFGIVLYEGSGPGEFDACGGGAQFGEHLCRFTGQAGLSASGGTISGTSYDSATNTTSFLFTTDSATNSVIRFSGTKRLPADAEGTGITDLQIMRPGHGYGDLLNSAFAQAMEPFSAFRVGPNWGDYTYATEPPVWEERAKPDGLFQGGTDSAGLAPWETLAAMANEMEADLWICLPPNADDAYITKIFQIFYYGSDGMNPYTSAEADPVWEPLDPGLHLYFEIGNEIWNWAYPYNTITQQMSDEAEAEIAAGDPWHYSYRGDEENIWYGIRCRVARFTVNASRLCREVVGDANMMTRFRPVISGQSSYPFMGRISISYLKCVYGGHAWATAWASGNFPGGYIAGQLDTPEDGISVNQFGNTARPLSYWIYGYAVAPYVNGSSVSELYSNLNGSVRDDMLTAISDAHVAGIEALAYEGGIESYHSYTEDGLDTVIEDMVGYWSDNGGGLFMYYAFAGNVGSGIYPDLTKQDPDIYPKIRAVRHLAGLD